MSDVWFAQCGLETDVALYCWYCLWVAIKEKLDVAIWGGHEGRISRLMSRSLMDGWLRRGSVLTCPCMVCRATPEPSLRR